MEIKKITLILFLFAFLCISCGDYPKNPRSVPTLRGLDKDGKQTSFVFNDCKATIIAFGASFCPPCQIDHNLLTKKYKALQKENICVLYINADESLEVMNQYIQKNKIPYPTLHWNYDLMNDLGNPYLLPTYFTANSKGDIKLYSKGMLGPNGFNKLYNEIKPNPQEKE